ncbi:MAG: hypothetical protein EOO02_13655 [Chitinophagaceae bacterium]|nr:MAG: hypothetical protein EOO02_13655 [Chitinophagaceae bacterium]
MQADSVTPRVIEIQKTQTVDSIGACQGVAIHDDRIFLYGDREIGVIREYRKSGDSLKMIGKELRLTVNGSDLINHPTGLAYRKGMPTFIGNSTKLNKEGTLWKTEIFAINWEGLQKTGTLDGNVVKHIDDNGCIQGARPEYVKYRGKWFVASADYGGKNNEVRLYDPSLLVKADSSSQQGVVVKRFKCSPWVQNLHFVKQTGVLVLIQNQVDGRKWRLTFVDMEKSFAEGKEHVLKVIDTDRADELEGFVFEGKTHTGIAVSSARKNNVNFLPIP